MRNFATKMRLDVWSIWIGILTLLLMLSMFLYQEWTLDVRIGSRLLELNNTINDRGDNLLSTMLAWISIILFLLTPMVGGALGIVSLVRGKAHIGIAISGLILNALCAAVFIFLVSLLLHSGV